MYYINKDTNYLVFQGLQIYENKIKKLKYERAAIFSPDEFQLAEFTNYNESLVGIDKCHARLIRNNIVTHNHPCNIPLPSSQDIKTMLIYKIKHLRIVTPSYKTRHLTIYNYNIKPSDILNKISPHTTTHTKVFSYG